MTILAVLIGAVLLLAAGGTTYSRFLARQIGSNPGRTTPAVARNDGRDYVPTPTPVVFAHHFAAIAGAGPIVGPVMAVIYGWGPALAWVLFGGLLIGGVHDYLAVHMTLREGGQSVAVVARRYLGKDAFVALMLFLIIMLALVCAAFLNLSAQALVSVVDAPRLGMSAGPGLFRVVGDQVVIGGIASMSVVILTIAAPLMGWMYIKRKVAVWKCSVVAVVVCALSIWIGLHYPIALPAHVNLIFGQVEGKTVWMLLLSGYVLAAAGAPVWLLLQSRDFINCHILYAGLGAMFLALIVVLVKSMPGGAAAAGPGPAAIPFLNIAEGTRAWGPIWPMLFITIACGAVSGFHSLCAGGTTCKQLTSESAARRVGYFAMLLETFLAVCVIAVMLLGTSKADYVLDVQPELLAGAHVPSNPILGFAMAVGSVGAKAFGISRAVGTLAGMILLEGFLVTTLDAAVRLTRYLFEEIWRTVFGRYDVFAEAIIPAEARAAAHQTALAPAGSGGTAPAPLNDIAAAVPRPIATAGLFRSFLKFLGHYWVNSGLAVAMTLAFAFSGSVTVLWPIFATANQLLAALVLCLVSIWLLRQGRRIWFAFAPGILMLATALASLILLLMKYLQTPAKSATLLTADIVLLSMTAYLLFAGVRAAVSFLRLREPALVLEK